MGNGGYRGQQRMHEALQTEQAEVDAAAISGRKLPGSKANPLAPRQAVDVGGMRAAIPGGTPFAENQVDVGTNIAPSSAQSFQVMTIVLGTGAMIGMLMLASIAVIIVFYLGWLQSNGNGDQLAKDKSHVRDTGLIEDIDPDTLRKVWRPRKGGKAKVEVAGDPMAEMFGGIGGAPVTVFTKGKMANEYHSIFIRCDNVPDYVSQKKKLTKQADGRYRAHIPIIPATRCRLVFQGNVPVKTYVTGGDNITCTFRPTVCR